jgi:hypothetical protein
MDVKICDCGRSMEQVESDLWKEFWKCECGIRFLTPLGNPIEVNFTFDDPKD